MAWAKLDPSPELAATIITEAGRWHAHYKEHSVEPRWRVLPHNWLAGENWLQDLPLIHKDSNSAAIANMRGKAKAKSPMPTKPGKPPKETSHGLSLNIKRFTIVDYQTEGSPFADWWEVFTFEGEDGTQFTERMHVLKSSTQYSDDAPGYYLKEELYRAAFGRGNPEGNYIGRVIGINGDADGIMFHHLPEENLPAPEPEPSLKTIISEPTAKPKPDSPPPARIQHKPVQIYESDVVDGVVSLLFGSDKGDDDIEYSLRLDSPAANATLAAICRACGKNEITDTEELHRQPIVIHMDEDGRIVDAEVNTWGVERQRREVAFLKRMQEEGWPDDDEDDTAVVAGDRDDDAA